MSAQKDYWSECISQAAEECDLKLTTEQLECLASAAESGHEHYGMAFYSPPDSDRISDVEREWKAKLKTLEQDHEKYVRNSEQAIKRALKINHSYHVSIENYGEVLMHDGTTRRVQ
jgi:hypothetical protein